VALDVWALIIIVSAPAHYTHPVTEHQPIASCRRRHHRLVMGKSIRIDTHCRIVMKNFDSVPQLQRFSYVHHCAARSRHGSHSRQCRHSLLQRQLAALLQCGPAGHGFGGLVQQLQDQCPEPLVWTVEGGSDRATNLIESNRFIFCRIAHHYRRRSRLCSLLYPA